MSLLTISHISRCTFLFLIVDRLCDLNSGVLATGLTFVEEERQKVTDREENRMNRDRSLRCAFLLLAVSLMVSLPALAQKITGDISGTVQDTTRAVVKARK